MNKTYGDNDNPRLEPDDAVNRDLAPPGMTGTSRHSNPSNAEPSREEKIAKLEAQLREKREARSLENKRGMYGETKGPFVAKRHFDRSSDFER